MEQKKFNKLSDLGISVTGESLMLEELVKYKTTLILEVEASVCSGSLSSITVAVKNTIHCFNSSGNNAQEVQHGVALLKS